MYKLDKRIVIQKYTSKTVNGFDSGDWIDYKIVWANINNLFGREYWEAKNCNAENTLNIVIRYSKDVEILNSKDYRIKWENRLFNITFIDNIKYENKYLKLKVLEVLK